MQLRVRGNEEETVKKAIQVVKVKEIVSPTKEVTVEMTRSRSIQEDLQSKVNRTWRLIEHGSKGRNKS